MNKNENYYREFLNSNPYPRVLKNHSEKNLIDFSSNDYLGLSTHPLLIQRSKEFVEKYGVGSTSSRLVSGNLPIYKELEAQIAEGLGKPSALILGTGFQTNTSVLESLLSSSVLKKEALVFCDKFCHASMIISARQHGKIHRFQHNDLEHLETLLQKYSQDDRPKFILAESVYSMDGDTADLRGLIELAKNHQAFLYIDDAHAVGLYGRSGWGKAAEYSQDIDVMMGTFSKGLGSFGGYIACSETIRDFLINRCKGLIYSTGLSPAILGAISAAIELLPYLEKERAQLAKNTQNLIAFFKEKNLNCGNANSHIIPWILGDAATTLQASLLLEKEGILAATIRPPSVPPGKCRIRFCASARHTDQQMQFLMDAIQKISQMLDNPIVI